ncbi:MAG: ABC transporter permease [Hyphomicrobiales bacterium]|nr:ABC transporter permease [Hyphomicrobiales bacterium]
MAKKTISHDVELLPPHGAAATLRRIGAMMARYVYLFRASPVRLLELMYWPFVQMLMWGFLQLHLSQYEGAFARGTGVLIGSVLLWDILFRGKIGFSICFLEEMWSRNLGQLLVSPLRANEFVAALSVMSILRLLVGLIPVTILAKLIFGFDLFALGLPLAAFFANLILTSWALALFTSGVILRYGLGAEELSWGLGFVLLPLACVYYPVDILPAWLQPVSLALPPTHVFEGMRAILLDGQFEPADMVRALALNGIYMGAGFGAFRFFLASARVNGSLSQIGE